MGQLFYTSLIFTDDIVIYLYFVIIERNILKYVQPSFAMDIVQIGESLASAVQLSQYI